MDRVPHSLTGKPAKSTSVSATISFPMRSTIVPPTSSVGLLALSTAKPTVANVPCAKSSPTCTLSPTRSTVSSKTLAPLAEKSSMLNYKN